MLGPLRRLIGRVRAWVRPGPWMVLGQFKVLYVPYVVEAPASANVGLDAGHTAISHGAIADDVGVAASSVGVLDTSPEFLGFR